MTSPRAIHRRREAVFLLCLTGPLIVGVLLNALVRPGLAQALGGVQHSNGGGVRSQDTWWTFDSAIHDAHPFVTSFLSVSNGAVAMCTLAAAVLVLVGRWMLLCYIHRSSSNT